MTGAIIIKMRSGHGSFSSMEIAPKKIFSQVLTKSVGFSHGIEGKKHLTLKLGSFTATAAVNNEKLIKVITYISGIFHTV